MIGLLDLKGSWNDNIVSKIIDCIVRESSFESVQPVSLYMAMIKVIFVIYGGITEIVQAA